MAYRFVLVVLGLLVYRLGFARAQDIDGYVPTQNRTTTSIAGQITDPAERRAFLALFKLSQPDEMLRDAKLFLDRFPQSAFLAQAYEVAARASFDLQDYQPGLGYAENSLALLPENVLLLVPVADIEAREHRDDAAIRHARDALETLDRFGPPASIAKPDWPELKKKLAATANFVLGRASLRKALELPAGQERASLIGVCESALSKARDLNAADPEITSLLGLAGLASGQLHLAAANFAAVYRGRSQFAPQALQNLQSIYNLLNVKSQLSFEAFLQQSEARRETASSPPVAPPEKNTNASPLSAYAGSEACRSCHADVYQAWSQSGMSKMFRP
jgi:hypothetical protein